MTLLDEARAVRERISARLRELEPLVREYNELRQAAAEMGIEGEEAAPLSAAAPSSLGEGDVRSGGREEAAGAATAQGATARPATGRQAGGEIGTRVLDAVRAEPGMTVAEYARRLNVPPASLYRPVRELTSRGAVVKRARQLFPA